MRKIIIVLLTIILIPMITVAQKTNDGGGRGGGNRGNGGGGGGGGGGNGECLESVVNVVGAIAGQYHRDLLKRSDRIELATSIEIMPLAGIAVPLKDGFDATYDFLPRLRLNGGAFSADFMVEYRADMKDFSVNPYKAGHGLLMFNILPNNSFRASIGQGVLYNMDSKNSKVYHESFLGFDVGISDRLITASLEGRLAYDYNNKLMMLLYIEGKGGFRLLKSDFAQIYVNAGLAYHKVADLTQDIIPMAGFNILLDY